VAVQILLSAYNDATYAVGRLAHAGPASARHVGPKGIFVNPFERGEIGPDLFRAAACNLGLEGLVSTIATPVSERQIEALGESEKPEPSLDGAGDGLIRIGTSPAFLSGSAAVTGRAAGAGRDRKASNRCCAKRLR
jgi:hypothetical protein